MSRRRSTRWVTRRCDPQCRSCRVSGGAARHRRRSSASFRDQYALGLYSDRLGHASEVASSILAPVCTFMPMLTSMTFSGRSGPEIGFTAYAESKLHDAMLAFAVARRWPDVFSNSLEPGWVATKMGGAGAPDDLGQAHLTQAQHASRRRSKGGCHRPIFLSSRTEKAEPAVSRHCTAGSSHSDVRGKSRACPSPHERVDFDMKALTGH